MLFKRLTKTTQHDDEEASAARHELLNNNTGSGHNNTNNTGSGHKIKTRADDDVATCPRLTNWWRSSREERRRKLNTLRSKVEHKITSATDKLAEVCGLGEPVWNGKGYGAPRNWKQNRDQYPANWMSTQVDLAPSTIGATWGGSYVGDFVDADTPATPPDSPILSVNSPEHTYPPLPNDNLDLDAVVQTRRRGPRPAWTPLLAVPAGWNYPQDFYPEANDNTRNVVTHVDRAVQTDQPSWATNPTYEGDGIKMYAIPAGTTIYFSHAVPITTTGWKRRKRTVLCTTLATGGKARRRATNGPSTYWLPAVGQRPRCRLGERRPGAINKLDGPSPSPLSSAPSSPPSSPARTFSANGPIDTPLPAATNSAPATPEPKTTAPSTPTPKSAVAASPAAASPAAASPAAASPASASPTAEAIAVSSPATPISSTAASTPVEPGSVVLPASPPSSTLSTSSTPSPSPQHSPLLVPSPSSPPHSPSPVPSPSPPHSPVHTPPHSPSPTPSSSPSTASSTSSSSSSSSGMDGAAAVADKDDAAKDDEPKDDEPKDDAAAVADKGDEAKDSAASTAAETDNKPASPPHSPAAAAKAAAKKNKKGRRSPIARWLRSSSPSPPPTTTPAVDTDTGKNNTVAASDDKTVAAGDTKAVANGDNTTVANGDNNNNTPGDDEPVAEGNNKDAASRGNKPAVLDGGNDKPELAGATTPVLNLPTGRRQWAPRPPSPKLADIARQMADRMRAGRLATLRKKAQDVGDRLDAGAAALAAPVERRPAAKWEGDTPDVTSFLVRRASPSAPTTRPAPPPAMVAPGTTTVANATAPALGPADDDKPASAAVSPLAPANGSTPAGAGNKDKGKGRAVPPATGAALRPTTTATTSPFAPVVAAEDLSAQVAARAGRARAAFRAQQMAALRARCNLPPKASGSGETAEDKESSAKDIKREEEEEEKEEKEEEEKEEEEEGVERDDGDDEKAAEDGEFGANGDQR